MYDLAIIGAGAGGLSCAAQALKAGLKIVLFDINRAFFGGVCLNKGCIPTKFCINSSKINKDWQVISTQKSQIIEKIKAPLLSHLQSQKVKVVFGSVSLEDKHTLNCSGEKFSAKHIIIASGSSPREIIKHKNAIFAEDIFDMPQLANKFLVVGAGSIGLEMASLLRNLGKNVLIAEKEEHILPAFNQSLSSRLRQVLEKKGITIETGRDIANYNLDEFDEIILAAGRAPNTQGLNLDKAGVECDARGCIITDKYMKTSVDNIYSCGDVTGKKPLAYIAQYQGKLCVDNILGKACMEDYSGIPECVFSLPQIAQVGILEEEAKSKNIDCKSIKSNFLKFSSIYAYDDTQGYIQVCIDAQGMILGAGIISSLASELINVFSICIKNRLKVKDIARCTFIHPTLSEIIPLLLEEA
ncbi:MAG: NAD(P)/FAD-dependent oxidoreductase [Candidatus Omnitrophica bacterium]|nr:NAD(P)/FAD-dependent oxidoreductase [Candidatus Omnitrophota bacterium]